MAGAALVKMLELGSSVPWQDALEACTGGRKLDASPILEFFDPLYEYLQQTSFDNGKDLIC